jgi:phospholipase/lecithinase/hemolysin
MHLILARLRAAHFDGVLMVVNQFSLDYSDAVGTALTQKLNQAVTANARQDGAVVADAFSSFEAAASTPFAGSSTCKAGLLNASPSDQFTCDVHPSQSGHRLLARTVEQAYAKATGE